jgi:hypothetical protein
MKKVGWYIIIVLFVFLQACKKSNQEPQGQSICASDQFHYINDFSITNATGAAAGHVDFTYAPYKVKLTATFNESVNWTITIRGNISNAIKTFTSTSSSVDIDWYGNADGDIFFRTGESCTISLSPACKSATTLSLIIDHSAIFDHFGYLIMDFEYLFPEYTYTSNVPGIDGYVRNVDTLLATPSPQGGRCRKLYAPQYHSGYYIGGFGNTAYDMANYAGNISSDSIYLNFYLKGNTNTTTTVVLMETVAGTDYKFTVPIFIDWTGWKFISLKFSDDIHIGVPANVKSIDIQAGPMFFNSEAECYVDFVILTKGKPYNGPN